MTGAFASSARASRGFLIRPSIVLAAGASLSLVLACAGSPESSESSREPQWTPTAEMHDARMGLSASVLRSGLVLVSGGGDKLAWTHPYSSNSLEYLRSAELYDPSSGTWAITGSMITPRAGPAFLVSRGTHAGEVMRVGGDSGYFETPDEWLHGQPLTTTEYYSETAGGWTPGPQLLHAPLDVIQLADGKLLAVGSVDVPGGPIGPEAQIIDPSDSEPTWRLVSPMNVPRFGFSMVLLANGEVLVVGGITQAIGLGVMSSDAERYDLVNDRWRKVASLPVPRVGEVLIRLPSGRVLLAGGCGNGWYNCEDPSRPPTADAWIYEPDQDVWRPTSPMNHPHALPSAVILDSGKVLVAGGNYKATVQGKTDYYPSPTPEIFDPDSETWSSTGPMPHYVYGSAAMVKLHSGAVLFMGGAVNGQPGKDEYFAIKAATLFQ